MNETEEASYAVQSTVASHCKNI